MFCVDRAKGHARAARACAGALVRKLDAAVSELGEASAASDAAAELARREARQSAALRERDDAVKEAAELRNAARKHKAAERAAREAAEGERAAREAAEARLLRQAEVALGERGGRERGAAEVALLRAELASTEVGLVNAQAVALRLGNKADELLSMFMASQGLAAETTGPAFISKNPQLRAFTPVAAAAKPNVGLLKPKHGRRAP